MPSADEWSKAIAEWVTEDCEPRKRIYLSVDSTVLDHIGHEKLCIRSGYADFLSAVRKQLNVPSQDGWNEAPHLKLPTHDLPGRVPGYTAFLAFLVICAAQRGERPDGYTGLGTEFFFPWFRKLLGGQPLRTRVGLGAMGETETEWAPEVELWRKWARFLKRLNFEPVYEQTYGGGKTNWGFALDQAILSSSCRRTLRAMTVPERRSFIAWSERKDADRDTEPPVPGATPHLTRLLTTRWNDEQVRDAVLSAIDGAPPGQRPGRHHIALVRHGFGQYALQARPPVGWGRAVRHNGQLLLGGEVRLEEFRPMDFTFEVGDAQQHVRWSPPPFVRFLESFDPLQPSRSGEPEIGEEHFLVIPRELNSHLEAARMRHECTWENEKCWGDYIEYSRFRLEVPLLKTSAFQLSVKSYGGLIFRHGLRTGEPGRVPRFLRAHRFGISAAEGSGRLTIEEREHVIEISDSTVEYFPDLPRGEYHLEFRGVRTRIELVDWKNVVYEGTPEPPWRQ